MAAPVLIDLLLYAIFALLQLDCWRQRRFVYKVITHLCHIAFGCGIFVTLLKGSCFDALFLAIFNIAFAVDRFYLQPAPH